MKTTTFLGDLSGTDLRDDAAHAYTWPGPDGRPWAYTSVTHIIGHLAAPELQRWYARMERDRCRERLAALKKGEIAPHELWREFDEKTEWAPAAEAYRDDRAGTGSGTHKEVARYVCCRVGGEQFDHVDTRDGVVCRVRSFGRWFEEEKPEFFCVEAPVFSRDHGYAGTQDAIATIDGKPLVLDYKISQRTRKNHALQLAAYRNADFIGLRNGDEHPQPHTVGGAVLLIHPDRCKLYPWPCGPEEFKAFRGLQAAQEWQRSARIPQEAL